MMDKSWTKITNKVDPNFMQGAIDFAEMAKGYIDSDGLTHCPCKQCLNVLKQRPDLVSHHIIHNGFHQSYEEWIFHGEGRWANETDDEGDETEYDTDDGVGKRRKRGPNINKKATQVLDKIKEIQAGARFTLTRDIYTMKFIGDSSTYFATELGILMRKFCPLQFHTWEKVPNENKEEMMDRLRAKFEIPHEDKALVACVQMHMQRQWKRTRSMLKEYWNKNGGTTNPSLAKSKMDPNCRNKQDWEHMCEYWETDKAQKYDDQMKQNRKKLLVQSRGGSRSIANHKFAMTDKNTQVQPSPIKLYYKLHFKTKWLNEASRIEYENIVKMKEEECGKLVSAGTTITPEMEYEIEKNAVTTVCSKPKTLLSGWEASSGPVMRKKDIPFFSAAESCQSTSKDDEDLKSKYAALEEEQRVNKEELRIYQEKVQKSEEKSEKLIQFMISKFPEARDMLFPNRDMDEPSDEE